MAIKNGAVYSWGRNQYGQLGDGSLVDRGTPVAISSMASGVTAIAAGDLHSLAIKSGAVYAWGYNGAGQLGDGTISSFSFTPGAVLGLSTNVTDVAAGDEHSLAIQNGALYAWGFNSYGQLGDGGTSTQRNIPIAVSNLSTNVTDVAAGFGFTLTVQNGAVFATGYNSDGQLGDGTHANRNTFQQVDPTDLQNIVAVAAAASSSYALSSDGSLWAWGDNSQGQLGLGDSVDRLTPQHLLAPAGYRFTSIDADAFGSHAIATLAPVPEPASLILFALGGIVAGAFAKRRRQKRRATSQAKRCLDLVCFARFVTPERFRACAQRDEFTQPRFHTRSLRVFLDTLRRSGTINGATSQSVRAALKSGQHRGTPGIFRLS